MGAISLYAKASPDFAQKLARSIALLQSSAQKHSPLTQASSLGAEDMVVTQLLEEAGIDSRIFVLETGMLHAETVALIPRIEERYLRHVDVYRPDLEAASAFVQANGNDAMYKSLELRKACCHIRKMEPLERALAGKKGWITGLRREQSSARAEVHDVEEQEGRAKINPLADWTWGDVWHYIALHNIPFNPLHDQFFPSIGCAPCTRAVTLGEDFRSGRWWWENESAKECGLHVEPHSNDAPASSLLRSERENAEVSAQAHAGSAGVKGSKEPDRSQQESAKECGLHVTADGTHEAEEPAAFEPLASPLSGRTSSIIPIREIPA